MSGIGEQPAIVHLRDFRLAGFTSGCVCIAPRRSTDMLQALKAGDYDAAERIRQEFQPMENLRNRISPIRVLHDAVTLSGIADMGPILPLLSNLEAADKPAVRDAVKQLLALNEKSIP
jgi:dihydrodipicolinate synthase/N-acetylneuraminate lyase